MNDVGFGIMIGFRAYDIEFVNMVGFRVYEYWVWYVKGRVWEIGERKRS